MPAVSDLEAIIDRLKWSWDHLQRFKLRMVESKVSYHWIPVTNTDSQGHRYVEFVIDEATPLPDDLPFMVGDCVHSLRASLDNLIYALCPTEYAEFPVCLTRKQWKRQAWKIRDLGKGPTKAVFDLQPFHPQHAPDPKGCPLWVLDRLWNDDKHRSPHLVMGIADSSVLSSSPPGWDHAVTCLGGPLEVGSVVAKVWFLPDTEPEVVPQFSFDVAFESESPARGRGVYYSLTDLHDVVGDIVEDFRPFFAS